MTMTAKNTSAPKEVRTYVLSVIDFEGTDKEKLEFFFSTFRSEYGHELARLGPQKAVCEYLRGLPSTINHAFANHEILDLLIDWGYVNAITTPSKEAFEMDQYWTRLAGSLVMLANKNGVNI